DFDPDRHQPRHRPQARLGEPEETGRLPAQPVGRQLRRRLAVEVEAERVVEGEPATRGPGGELNAPGANDAIESQEPKGKKVAHANAACGMRQGGGTTLPRTHEVARALRIPNAAFRMALVRAVTQRIHVTAVRTGVLAPPGLGKDFRSTPQAGRPLSRDGGRRRGRGWCAALVLRSFRVHGCCTRWWNPGEVGRRTPDRRGLHGGGAHLGEHPTCLFACVNDCALGGELIDHELAVLDELAVPARDDLHDTAPAFSLSFTVARYFSTAIAAVVASPTAVVIWRVSWLRTSPAAKRPGMEVIMRSSVMR